MNTQVNSEREWSINDLNHICHHDTCMTDVPFGEYEWLVKLAQNILSANAALPSSIIIGHHLDELRKCNTIEDAIKVSREWIFSRHMIDKYSIAKPNMLYKSHDEECECDECCINRLCDDEPHYEKPHGPNYTNDDEFNEVH